MKYRKSLRANFVSEAIQSLITLYQKAISPLLGNHCRFYPSCSEYSKQAVQSRGALRGMWMSLKRLLRCHPFSDGGFDPVESRIA